MLSSYHGLRVEDEVDAEEQRSCRRVQQVEHVVAVEGSEQAVYDEDHEEDEQRTEAHCEAARQAVEDDAEAGDGADGDSEEHLIHLQRRGSLT